MTPDEDVALKFAMVALRNALPRRAVVHPGYQEGPS